MAEPSFPKQNESKRRPVAFIFVNLVKLFESQSSFIIGQKLYMTCRNNWSIQVLVTKCFIVPLTAFIFTYLVFILSHLLDPFLVLPNFPFFLKILSKFLLRKHISLLSKKKKWSEIFLYKFKKKKIHWVHCLKLRQVKYFAFFISWEVSLLYIQGPERRNQDS